MKHLCCLLVFILIMETSEETNIDDNIDIYDDVCDFDLGDEVEKLKCENKELGEQIQILEKHVETLQGIITKLRETQATLRSNISALFLTAKSEIERKDRMITDLRTEIDNICFRRRTYVDYKRRGTEDVEHSAAKRFKCDDSSDNRDRYEDTYDRHRSNDGRHRNRSMDREERDDRERRYSDKERDIKYEYRRPDNRNFEGRNERKSRERSRCDRQGTPIAEQKHSNNTETSNSPIVVIDLEKELDIKKNSAKQRHNSSKTLSDTSSTDSEASKLAKKQLKLVAGIEKKKRRDEGGSRAPKTKKSQLLKKDTWQLIQLKKDRIAKNCSTSLLKGENLQSADKAKNVDVDCMIDLTEDDEVLTQEEETSSFMDFFVIKDEDQDENTDLTPEKLKTSDQCESTIEKIHVEEKNTETEVTSTTSKENLAVKDLTITSENCEVLTTKDKAQDENEKEVDGSTEEITSSKVDGKSDQECFTKEDNTVTNIDGSKIVQKSSPIDTSGPNNEEDKDSSTMKPEEFSKEELLKHDLETSTETEAEEELPNVEVPSSRRLTKVKDTEKKDGEELEKELNESAEKIKDTIVDKNTPPMNMPSLFEEENACLKEDKRKPMEALKVDGEDESKEEMPTKKKKVDLAEDTTNVNLKQNTTTAFFVKNRTKEDSEIVKAPLKEDKADTATEEIEDEKCTKVAETVKKLEPAKAASRNKRSTSVEEIARKLEKKLHSLFDSENSLEEGEIVEEDNTYKKFSRERSDPGVKDKKRHARYLSKEEPRREKVGLKRRRSDGSLLDPKRKIYVSKVERRYFQKRHAEKEDESRRSSRDSPKERKPKAEKRTKDETRLKYMLDASKSGSKREDSKNIAEAKERMKQWKIPKLKEPQVELKRNTFGAESTRDSLKMEDLTKAVEQKSKEINADCRKIDATKDTNKEKDIPDRVQENSRQKNVASADAKLKENMSITKVRKESLALVEESKEDTCKELPECSKMHAKEEESKENVETREDIAVFSLLKMASSNNETERDKTEPLTTPSTSEYVPVEAKPELKKNTSKTNVRLGSVLKEGSSKPTEEDQSKTGAKQCSEKEDIATDFNNPVEDTKSSQRKDAKDAAKQKQVASKANRRSKEGSPKVVEKAECSKINTENGGIGIKEKTQVGDCSAPDILKDEIDATKDSQRRNDVATVKQRQESKKVVSRANSRRRSMLKESSPKTGEKAKEESGSKLVVVCSRIDDKEDCGQEASGIKEKAQLTMDCSTPEVVEDKLESTESPHGKDDVAKHVMAKQRQESKKVAFSMQTRANSRRRPTLKEDSKTESEMDIESEDRKEDSETKEKAQRPMKAMEDSKDVSEVDSGPKLKTTTENLGKNTKQTVTNGDKREESETKDELQESEQPSAIVPDLQTTIKETRRRVRITSIAVSKITKLTPKKSFESCEDDLDSDSSASINASILEEEKAKLVHNRLDNLIKNYIEDSSVENVKDISNNQIGDDKKSLVNNVQAPVANTRTRRRFRWSESEKPEQIKSPVPASNTNSPDAVIPRRRITPTPVKDKPICSFENILEKTTKSPSFPKIISPLHLTHDGEIPVLHLEENHISNLPTESNINDKNIISLLDTMNISNLEGDTPKFVNETAINLKESNLNISPIKCNNLTTFENIIKKVTSTPIVSSGKPDECLTTATKSAASSDKVVNASAPPPAIRRRRRCRLIIAD